MHYLTHTLIFFGVIALDLLWLFATGRFTQTLETVDAMVFGVLSRILVYLWIAFTVLPAIRCTGDTQPSSVSAQAAMQGIAAFGFWNFANVSSLSDARMPFIDTVWGAVVTVIIALFSVEVETYLGRSA